VVKESNQIIHFLHNGVSDETFTFKQPVEISFISIYISISAPTYTQFYVQKIYNGNVVTPFRNDNNIIEYTGSFLQEEMFMASGQAGRYPDIYENIKWRFNAGDSLNFKVAYGNQPCFINIGFKIL